MAVLTEDLAGGGGVNGIAVPSDAERATADAGKKEELVPRVIGGSDPLEHEGEAESAPPFPGAGGSAYVAIDAKRATAAETAALVPGDAPEAKLRATHGHTNNEPVDPRGEGDRKAEEERHATDGAKKKEASGEVGAPEAEAGDAGRPGRIAVPSDAERATAEMEDLGADAEELVPRVVHGSDPLEHEGEAGGSAYVTSDAKGATAAEIASLVPGDAPEAKLGATHGHTNTEPVDARGEGGRKAEEERPAIDGAKKKEGSEEENGGDAVAAHVLNKDDRPENKDAAVAANNQTCNGGRVVQFVAGAAAVLLAYAAALTTFHDTGRLDLGYGGEPDLPADAGLLHRDNLVWAHQQRGGTDPAHHPRQIAPEALPRDEAPAVDSEPHPHRHLLERDPLLRAHHERGGTDTASTLHRVPLHPLPPALGRDEEPVEPALSGGPWDWDYNARAATSTAVPGAVPRPQVHDPRAYVELEAFAVCLVVLSLALAAAAIVLVLE